VIYVEVPDRRSIQFRPPNDNALGALHCHLYDPRSLSAVLEMAGLVPLSLERVFEPSGKLSVYAFATLPEVAARLSAKPSSGPSAVQR
jgi:hypothetical protein